MACGTEFTINTDKKLGQGAYGVVYMGCMIIEGREEDIAVKRISLDRVEAKSILKELDTLRSVGTHKNIIKLLGYESTREYLSIYMEYANQGNLEEYLQRLKTNLDLVTKLQIMTDCAGAVSYMHQLMPPVVHRDIKLANIVLQTDGKQLTSKLVDFGFATMYDSIAFMSTATVGTPAFWPPELFRRGRKQYSEGLDVYSLGLVYLVILQYDCNDQIIEPTPGKYK